MIITDCRLLLFKKQKTKNKKKTKLYYIISELLFRKAYIPVIILSIHDNISITGPNKSNLNLPSIHYL